jgi:glycosyltransferase involved in cell wall biosynthesis
MFNNLRILWFCNTPSRYGATTDKYNGGGWVSSLEEEIAPEVHLGVVFLAKESPLDPVRIHGKASWSVVRRNSVSYYPVVNGYDISRGDRIKTLLWGDAKQEENLLECFMDIVYSYKPDVIQVFGSEHLFGLVALHTDIPVVLHIQGILAEYSKVFVPPGVSINRWLTTPFRPALFFQRLFSYFKWNARLQREDVILHAVENFIGRTQWDHDCTLRINPSAHYFHGGEILRPVFYESEPHSEDPEVLTIVSTISEPPYKGLDVLLLAGYLLNKKGVQFRWRVYGNVTPAFFERISNVSLERSGLTLEGVADANALCIALREATLSVHPSYIDNSPNSVCEAQILGLPVIASEVGGVPSLIEDGVDGILFPSGNAEALVEAICSLAEDVPRRASLGEQARKTALVRHDKETIVKELLQTYAAIKQIDD